jgi:hypothetical protein
MDKTLLNRVAALERRVADLRDVEAMSLDELQAYLFDELGYAPTHDDLVRIAAGKPLER